MTEITLKEYVKQIVDLETAVYTQRRLGERYNEKQIKNIPISPKDTRDRRDFEEIYNMPMPPTTFNGRDMRFVAIICAIIAIVAGVLTVIFGIAGIQYSFSGREVLERFICASLVFVIMSLIDIAIYFSYRKHIKVAKESEIRYEQEINLYQTKKQDYQERQKQQQQEYAESVCNYEQEIANYHKATQEGQYKNQIALFQLENTLEELYAKDIIFPKYRNLVAMTAIYEYLASGRCTTLEGSDGAYNLYEMELRQNIVIGQISIIIGNLEAIKNNQFILYQELSKANQQVDMLLAEMRNVNQSVKLAAYYAHITALAETAPKVTVII